GFGALATWRSRRLRAALAESEQQVRRLLYSDPVTALPNRPELDRRLVQALAARQPEQCVALIVLDLEGFRDAWYAIGEAAGQEVLVEIAARLRQVAPPGAVVGRGRSIHRFGMLVPATDPQTAHALAEAAHAAISR